jgi:hypothetical protein
MKELGSFSRPAASKKASSKTLARPPSRRAHPVSVKGDDESRASEAEDVQPRQRSSVRKPPASIQAIKVEDVENDNPELQQPRKPETQASVIIMGDDEETASEAEAEDVRKPSPAQQRESGPAKITMEAVPTIGKRAVPAIPGVCGICSLENGKDDLTCAACSHVLDTSKLLNCWPCTSLNCKDLGYINVGDNGICTLCGTAKNT